MDCKVVSLNEKDRFIPKIKSSDPVITSYFNMMQLNKLVLKKDV